MERLTTCGTLAGLAAPSPDGAHAWLGVPYAKAPVGALRWRAPAAPEAWTGVRPATQFGNPCVQVGRLYGPGRNNRYDRSIGDALGQVTGSEDCLYLNIWTPAAAASPLPVIVYIHGGSNITGYTADPLYDGANLAATAQAVVVTVNYRLGIFGFLHLAQLKTGDPLDDSGNFALLDIVQALRYVQDNIAAFGGDPGNVTLMGQSAGAVNIWALLVSPLLADAAPPLLHRALPISGSVATAADLPPGRLPVLQPLAAHAAQGDALLRHASAGAAEAGDVAAWLRAQGAERLLSIVLNQLAPLGLASSGPVPDGAVVPAHPLAALRTGAWRRVPVLAGYTRDEGKLFPALLALSPLLGGMSGRLLGDAAVFDIQYSEQPDASATTALADWIPPALLPVDAPGTGFNARMAQLDALFFHPNRDAMLDAVRAGQDSVWCYQFDWDRQPAPFDAIYGAAHGFDIPFIFGNFGPAMFAAAMNSPANRAGRLALSAAMMRSVGAFARTGNPNHAGLGVHWPAWPVRLLFDAGDSAAAISLAQP